MGMSTGTAVVSTAASPAAIDEVQSARSMMRHASAAAPRGISSAGATSPRMFTVAATLCPEMSAYSAPSPCHAAG